MFCLEPPRVVSISDLSFDWIFTFLGESYGRWRKIKPIDVRYDKSCHNDLSLGHEIKLHFPLSTSALIFLAEETFLCSFVLVRARFLLAPFQLL